MEIELPMTVEEESLFFLYIDNFEEAVFTRESLLQIFSLANRAAMGRYARGRKLEGAHGEVIAEVLKRLET